MSKVEQDNRQFDRAIIAEALRMWRGIQIIDDAMTEWSNQGMVITSINIKGPELSQGGYFAIIKALDESRKGYVCFRSAGSIKELHEKVSHDLEAGTLAMKEDKPWKPPAG